MPSVGPYCSARARCSAATSRHERAYSSRRERRRVGQPAGERDDVGALGERHQVAHRGGLHDPRARGEERRVALEVARRRGRAWAVDGPCRLRRRVRPQLRPSPMHDSSSTSAPGARASAARGRRCGRSCPCCSPARSPPPTSASTSTARLPLPRVALVAARRVVPLAARCCRRSLAAARATRGAAARWRRRWPASPRRRRAAVRRHARRPRARVGGPGWSRGSLCAALASAAARDLLSRARAARLDRRRARALPRLPRRRRCSWRRAVAVLLPPLGSSCSRFLAWLLARRPPARGEKYAGPAHPAVSWPQAEARPRVIDGDASRRCSSARSRPAARRRWRRSSSAAPTSTTASPRSPRSRRSARPRSPPARRQDEHHIPAMNWFHRERAPLRRVRLELPRGAALRHRPASSPTPSTT